MPCLTSSEVARASDPTLRSSACATPNPTTIPRIRELETLLETAVASWNAGSSILQQRRWHRVAYVKPLILTPLAETSNHPAGEPVVVSGRDISLGGLSFEHAGILPCTHAALSFVQKDDVSQPVLLQLTWCRFTRLGVYLSGGKFLRVIDDFGGSDPLVAIAHAP